MSASLPASIPACSSSIGFALVAAADPASCCRSTLDIFRLNLVGKYLTYAFVAVGLVLCWGYTGILSLGQGVFFGLGGYCMAMFLKLEASSVANTKIQSTPGIPGFHGLEPDHRAAVLLGPVQVAAVHAARGHRGADDRSPSSSASAMFKRRVGGVYFAIITQALAAVLTILIVGQQGYTGGINGITDLRTLLGWDIRTDSAKYILYFVCCFLLLGTHVPRALRAESKLGRILVAMRDKEDRVRFSGYDVANFKIFVFCLASAMAAVGGAMFTLQVGFMSPSFVGIVPSIEMVIFCAVGGRHSLVGAVVGTLLVNWGKTVFSESFPGTVAVRHGRPVHRRGARVPARSGGPGRPIRFIPRLGRLARHGATASRARRRRNEWRRHHGQQHRLSARARERQRLLRRLQGGQRAQPLHRQGRAARDHRPERRRQDHRARPDLRPDPGFGRLDQVQEPGNHRPARSRKSSASGSGASSRPRRSTKT